VVLFWIGLSLTFSVPLGVTLFLVALHYYLRIRYLHLVDRIFVEKPLFIIPRGQPIADAEDVRFPTADGLQLAGCYLRATSRRRGVILFGLEFGSNRWSCLPYCEHLLRAGFDVFAYESRNQGDSDAMPGYEPLQWLTAYEVLDAEAALAYLKARPDADPNGVGLFGISKGGAAGLYVAAGDPYIRCCLTDGAFATYPTLVPYMRQWFRIYNQKYFLQGLLPSWYYGQLGMIAIRRVERVRHCRFPHLERRMKDLAPRPVLLIHGGDDTYIRPEMARKLYEKAREPRDFWVVEGAKHNQALHTSGEEYRRRVLDFFEKHLAAGPGPEKGEANGSDHAEERSPDDTAPRERRREVGPSLAC
jgi:fermentation-respiration switch protein FrsA (DUF1100 family)